MKQTIKLIIGELDINFNNHEIHVLSEFITLQSNPLDRVLPLRVEGTVNPIIINYTIVGFHVKDHMVYVDVETDNAVLISISETNPTLFGLGVSLDHNDILRDIGLNMNTHTMTSNKTRNIAKSNQNIILASILVFGLLGIGGTCLYYLGVESGIIDVTKKAPTVVREAK